jgi:CheY-like chemotaxis protein
MTKILLVEDSKFLRLAMERALSRAGYAVTSAADGEQALQMAREKLPHLILLDMLLPKLSGPDVLIALKKDPMTEAIPVVVISGMSQKNAPRLQQDGALSFIEKSALALEEGSGKLLAAVEQILRNLPEVASAPTEWTIDGAVENESSASSSGGTVSGVSASGLSASGVSASGVSASTHGNK